MGEDKKEVVEEEENKGLYRVVIIRVITECERKIRDHRVVDAIEY